MFDSFVIKALALFVALIVIGAPILEKLLSLFSGNGILG